MGGQSDDNITSHHLVHCSSGMYKGGLAGTYYVAWKRRRHGPVGRATIMLIPSIISGSYLDPGASVCFVDVLSVLPRTFYSYNAESDWPKGWKLEGGKSSRQMTPASGTCY